MPLWSFQAVRRGLNRTLSKLDRMFQRQVSVQVEVDFDSHLHVHGMSIFLAGFEAPRLYRLDGFFIQSHAEGIHHANIGGAAVGGDDDHQRAGSLIFCLAGFFGKFRIGGKNRSRRSYTSAGTEYAATHASARAWTYARSRTGTNARPTS